MRFRLIVDEPWDGAHNMAVDELLFRSALEPTGTASLRLYSFRSPTVSLGHRQRVEEAVDREACRRLGIEWVRRPTGGRALLHQHELTYCVVAPAREAFLGLSVRGVYDRVSAALRRALLRFRVPLDPPASLEKEGGRERPLTLPCLAVPSSHEITSGGRKLVASAQRRSSKGFLQHGAILFAVDAALWRQIAPGGSNVPLEAVGLDDLTETTVPRGELVRALSSSFEEMFQGEAVSAGLTPKERRSLPAYLDRYRSTAPGSGRSSPPRGFAVSRLVDNSEAVW